MNYYNPENPDNTFFLDIEADGLEPARIWCAVLQKYGTEEQIVFTNKEDFVEWHRSNHCYIGHNLLSFDVPCLNRLWDAQIDLLTCVDTLVLSYLYNPALQGGHSLEAWGERLRFPKGDFHDWSRYSEEMLS